MNLKIILGRTILLFFGLVRFIFTLLLPLQLAVGAFVWIFILAFLVYLFQGKVSDLLQVVFWPLLLVVLPYMFYEKISNWAEGLIERGYTELHQK